MTASIRNVEIYLRNGIRVKVFEQGFSVHICLSIVCLEDPEDLEVEIRVVEVRCFFRACPTFGI